MSHWIKYRRMGIIAITTTMPIEVGNEWINAIVRRDKIWVSKEYKNEKISQNHNNWGLWFHKIQPKEI
jgi:hypothetical protein